MSILKKTVFAGLAAVTMATTGTALTATSAEAHYKSYYKTYKSCYYKQVWKKDYWGHYRLVNVKVCH